MGIRFRKSVKICKGLRVNFSKTGASVSLGGRGHSLNVGKKGAMVTAGIPGTGLSYSTKISAGGKKPSQRRSSATNQFVPMPAQASVYMNDKGQIISFDGMGNEIDEIIRAAEFENEQYLNIYKMSTVVDTFDQFMERFNALEQEEYEIKEFLFERPSEDTIKAVLMEEAKKNVKASIFVAGKLRKEYVDERVNQRYAQALSAWEQNRYFHYQEQDRIKKDADARFYEEYRAKKEFLSALMNGEEDAVCEVFDEWIASCELPVEMNIDYDWNREKGILMLDVDLPEIEDLPDTKMTKTSGGNLKEKKKTQTELRKEYSALVFGLAVFISSHAFNTSPAIKHILISGYTQRRDKEGSLIDNYIYSLKFERDQFENKNLSVIDPKEFCMLFENRCNMTTTSLLKKIKPFEEF